MPNYDPTAVAALIEAAKEMDDFAKTLIEHGIFQGCDPTCYSDYHGGITAALAALAAPKCGKCNDTGLISFGPNATPCDCQPAPYDQAAVVAELTHVLKRMNEGWDGSTAAAAEAIVHAIIEAVGGAK